MKLAIITTLWAKNKGGGIISRACTYIPTLKYWGADADLIVLSVRGKPSVNVIDYADFDPIFLSFKEAGEFINENYDLVDFLTFRDLYENKFEYLVNLLDSIFVPWVITVMGVQGLNIYSSVDLEKLILLGNFVGATFSSISVQTIAKNIYNCFSDDNTIVHGVVIPLNKLIIQSEKSSVIVVAHSRILEWKRTHLIVEMADKLYANGVDDIRIYGNSIFQYMRRMEELEGFPLINWMGSFEYGEVSNILQPAMFDIDFSHFYRPPKGVKVYKGYSWPQSTLLEAMSYGAIPVINENMCWGGLEPEKNVVAVRADHEIEDAMPQIVDIINDNDRRIKMIKNNKKFLEDHLNRGKDLLAFYTRRIS